MTKRLPTQLRFIFVVLSLLIIPTFTSALDLSASALPVWSDQIGGFSVTSDCSDDGRYVVAGSDTGTVRMYTYTGGILWTYRIPEKSVTAVAISGDGSVVAAADYDPLGPDAGGEILYFTRDGELVWRSHTGATVQRVALSDDGNTLLASGNSALYVYDKTGTRQSTFRLNETIWSVAVSGDGSRGVAGAGYGHGELFATDTNGTVSWSYPTANGMQAVSISGNGGSIAGVDRFHLYWFDRDKVPAWQFNASTVFETIAVSADGEYGATGSQYYLRFFNRTGSLLWTYQDPGTVGSVALSANASRIIAGTSSGTMLFDREGTMLWKFGNATTRVSASKDGRFYVASSPAGVVLLQPVRDS